MCQGVVGIGEDRKGTPRGRRDEDWGWSLLEYGYLCGDWKEGGLTPTAEITIPPPTTGGTNFSLLLWFHPRHEKRFAADLCGDMAKGSDV